MSKILIISPYPAEVVPSQRFRFEQYLSRLHKNGFKIVVKPFFTKKAYLAFYQYGKLFPKIHAITSSYIERFRLLLQVSSFDFIFIHREASPMGPPIFEWIVAKVIRKKIIYDFDDAIWLTDRMDESAVARFLRWRRKVDAICKWSYKISCGNAYLAAHALQFNANVTVIPTTIDTENLHAPASPRDAQHETVTIGWTGSHSTLKYLHSIVAVLQSLESKYANIKTLIIAEQDPKLPLRNSVFRPWRKKTEIADLATIDIGIMPLPDDPWTRGKCGFKALQYMSLEIPAVISPVGVNTEIVQHGVEGFLCETPEDWFTHLEELILNPDKRVRMGKRGRQKVIDHYSVKSNASAFLSLFQ